MRRLAGGKPSRGQAAHATQGFDLGSKKGDIEAIIQSNAFMAELQSRIVPLIVQYDAFWTRYFYQCVLSSSQSGQRRLRTCTAAALWGCLKGH